MSKTINLIQFSDENNSFKEMKEFMKSNNSDFDIRKLIDNYQEKLEFTELRMNHGPFYNSINYAICYYMLSNAIKEGYTDFDKYLDKVIEEKKISEKIYDDPDIEDSINEFLNMVHDTFKNDSSLTENKEYLYSYFDLISNHLSNGNVYIYFAGLVSAKYIKDLTIYSARNFKSIYSTPVTPEKIEYIKNNIKPISDESIMECGEFYFNILFDYGLVDYGDGIFIYLDLEKMPYLVKWIDSNILMMVTENDIPKTVFRMLNDKFPDIDITLFSKVNNADRASIDVTLISKNKKSHKFKEDNSFNVMKMLKNIVLE